MSTPSALGGCVFSRGRGTLGFKKPTSLGVRTVTVGLSTSKWVMVLSLPLPVVSTLGRSKWVR